MDEIGGLRHPRLGALALPTGPMELMIWLGIKLTNGLRLE